MQTFLPYPDFYASANVLDMRRLGKQRVEAWQILRVLRGESQGWQHHPAVRMWRGYVPALCEYGVAVCTEWLRRGYRDALLANFTIPLAEAWRSTYTPPPWLGREDFHRAHRSNLLRKAPEFYGSKFNDVPADLPYVWPV